MVSLHKDKYRGASARVVKLLMPVLRLQGRRVDMTYKRSKGVAFVIIHSAPGRQINDLVASVLICRGHRYSSQWVVVSSGHCGGGEAK